MKKRSRKKTLDGELGKTRGKKEGVARRTRKKGGYQRVGGGERMLRKEKERGKREKL